MSLKVKASELPNPFLLTAPENLEYMEKKEAETAAAQKEKAKPAPKRKRGGAENVEDINASPKKPTTKKAKTGKGSKDASSAQHNGDPFSVSLEGDETGTAEIFDTCDEVRRKINSHLRDSGITKAAFMRDLARAGWPDGSSKVQSKQLTDFLNYRGASEGSTSKVFYGAYVYFEKKRIAEGKPKSAHRLAMEAEWSGKGGFPRERRRGFWCAGGDVPVENNLGVVRIQRGR